MKLTNIQKRAYFSKLFLTNLFAFMIVTVFIVCSFYLYNYKLITNERDLTNTSKIMNYSSNMDIRLQAAMAQIEKYRNQQNFVSFAMSNEYTQSNIYEIYNQLDENRFLLDTLGIAVGVVQPKLNVSLLTGNFNKLNLSDLNMSFENLSLTNYTFIETGGVIPLVGEIQNPGMLYAISQQYQGEHRLIFLLVVYDINNEVLGKNENYFTVDNNNVAITVNPEPIPENITSYLAGSNSIKQTNAIYTRSSSVFPTLKYVYYNKNNPTSLYLIFQILLILIAMTILSVWLAHAMSNRLYTPIGNVITSLQKINKTDFVDEVKYVTDTANKMLDSINELAEKNKQQINLIKNKFIYDLCIGTVTKSDAEKLTKEYSLDLLTKSHVVILFEISNSIEIVEHYDSETYMSIKYDLINMFFDAINKKDCYVFETGYNRFAFILDSNIDDVKTKINELCISIEFTDDINIIAAIGSEAVDCTQTENSYHDAVYILDNCFYTGDTYVYTMDQVTQKQKSGLYYPIEIERQIIENMTNSKQLNAISLVEKIIDYNIKEGFSKQKQTELKFLIISTINRILSHINQSVENIFGSGTVLYLELTADNEADYKEKIIAVFEELGKNLPTGDDSDNTQLKKIVEFIDQNIDKDISLLDLSNYLNMSTWYVSRLFKIIVKQNFKSYVNGRRVEIAKKILKDEPNAVISNIAVRVGCNNTVTFNRTFKKYTGLSPSQFRQMR